MPAVVKEFVRAHIGDLNWDIVLVDGHWYGRNLNSDKLYFLI